MNPASDNIPTILNPGHTGGALELSQLFRRHGLSPPPLVEFSTLTYVARLRGADEVVVTGRAKSVRAAAIPGGRQALAAASSLYNCARSVANVLVTSLANVNMVLHPPGTILAAAWIEATAGDFTFYVEGLTEGVARVMEQLDAERRAVAHGLGIELPCLFDEMQSIGTIESTVDAGIGCEPRSAAVLRIEPSGRRQTSVIVIFRKTCGTGLEPFLALAAIAGVETPIARSLRQLGELAAGPFAPAGRRTAIEMGIAGLDKSGLLKLVTSVPIHEEGVGRRVLRALAAIDNRGHRRR